ncbi:helix-turn-helix domain-containing protein [Ornithinimicrobium sp. W1665]|uniref:helix-turn-helix domain-containing protein n=1 Tax=Ornithinimicrobium sp. W1665 TaxID=3416666 RepID=UPI003CECCEC9
MTETTGLWWRHNWMNAVYSSDLKPLERFVASIFADHARDQRLVWVTMCRLMERTGLSRDAANRALKGLRDSGWLVVVEKGRQHKPTTYAMVIPGGSRGSGERPPEQPSSTGDGPLSSTGDGPLAQSSSTPHDASSTSPVIQQYGRRTQSKVHIKDPNSSSSPARRHAAHLLAWDEEDERLDLIDDFLKAHNVKSAQAWMTRCHERGDLERNFLAFVQDANDPWGVSSAATDDTWMTRKGPDAQTMLERLYDEFVDQEAADHQIAYEGEAMYGNPRPLEELLQDRTVLRSVLSSIQNDRAWGVIGIPGLRPAEAKEAS